VFDWQGVAIVVKKRSVEDREWLMYYMCYGGSQDREGARQTSIDTL
jgi:hypothetical protein